MEYVEIAPGVWDWVSLSVDSGDEVAVLFGDVEPLPWYEWLSEVQQLFADMLTYAARTPPLALFLGFAVLAIAVCLFWQFYRAVGLSGR
jgi:hypothetical protein